LPEKFPSFYKRLTAVLSENNIPYALVPGTKDIWVRDFMPVQVQPNKYVQFRYEPGYLTPEYQHLKSDPERICASMGISTIKSDLVIDGGNIVRGLNKIILCKRALNNEGSQRQIESQLRELLEVEDVILIPDDKHDLFGHADGIVRFVDEKTVLLNQYKGECTWFTGTLNTDLKSAGLEWVRIPYNPYNNKDEVDATGIYMNFLQIKDVIIVPVFNIKEDDEAVRSFESIFREYKILTVISNEIAKEGGVLNCCTWRIFKSVYSCHVDPLFSHIDPPSSCDNKCKSLMWF
jgi:agmatine deiminase